MNYIVPENCSLFNSLCYEICLTGDFKCRCLSKCEYSGKTVLADIKQRYNGVKLSQFVEAANLTIANSLNSF